MKMKNQDTIDYILDMYNIIELFDEQVNNLDGLKNIFKQHFKMLLLQLEEKDLESFISLNETVLVYAIEDYHQVIINNMDELDDHELSNEDLMIMLISTFRIIVSSKLLIYFNHDVEDIIKSYFNDVFEYKHIWYTIQSTFLN